MPCCPWRSPKPTQFTWRLHSDRSPNGSPHSLRSRVVNARCLGEAFSAGLGGHVSRVFVGVTVGWRTGGSIPTAEEILAHFEEIEDQNGYQVPLSVIEQMQSLSDGVSGEIV